MYKVSFSERNRYKQIHCSLYVMYVFMWKDKSVSHSVNSNMLTFCCFLAEMLIYIDRIPASNNIVVILYYPIQIIPPAVISPTTIFQLTTFLTSLCPLQCFSLFFFLSLFCFRAIVMVLVLLFLYRLTQAVSAI